MIDPTSLSTPQSVPDGAKSSNSNLNSPSLEGLKLSDIPVFNTRMSTPQPCGEPVSCTTPESDREQGLTSQFEYHFRTYADGEVMHIYLWADNDQQACERVLRRVDPAAEYDQPTGSCFVKDTKGNDYTFTKSLYNPDYNRPVLVKDPVRGKLTPTMSAEDILAGL